MAELERKPVLVHVGYHRTGSSWLQKHVFAQPKTGFLTIGKSNDDDPVRRVITARWSEYSGERLRRRFEHRFEKIHARDLVPVVSFERLSGHACSGGYDSGAIAERLHQVIPEARILIVIREQQAAILSTYRRYVRAGGPGSLRQFVSPPATTNLRVPLFDFRHFEYHHLVRRYQKLFGRDAVLVLAYEQFDEDPRAFVARIGTFMGKDVPERILDRLPYAAHEQAGLSPAGHYVLRLLNRVVRSEVNPAPLLDLKLQHELKRLAQHPTVEALVPQRFVQNGEEQLRRELQEVTAGRYAESNRVTAELTGLDLAGYGYAV